MLKPTIGQLEREITHRVRSLYNFTLGQRLDKIVCHFFGTELAISLDNSVSKVEQTLLNSGYEVLAEQVRLDLDKLMKPHLKNLIEEVIGNHVLDMMSNTTLTTGHTGIIVMLDDSPNVRNPESIPKVKLKTITDSDSAE
jgi:uncharacterized protein YbcI